MEIPMQYLKSWGLSALAAAAAVSLALPAAALTVVNTKGLHSTHNAGEQASFTTNSVAWVNLYSTNITVPNGAGSLYLRARFTAESLCTGITGICRVRIVYGNGMVPLTELEPASGLDFAFDSTDSGAESANSAEGHAIERHAKWILPPGIYQVTVQVSVDDPFVTFTVDDWHLALELLWP
jgi:hypothetical protein